MYYIHLEFTGTNNNNNNNKQWTNKKNKKKTWNEIFKWPICHLMWITHTHIIRHFEWLYDTCNRKWKKMAHVNLLQTDIRLHTCINCIVFFFVNFRSCQGSCCYMWHTIMTQSIMMMIVDFTFTSIVYINDNDWSFCRSIFFIY